MEKSLKIRASDIKTRDYLTLMLISGVTKAAIHKNLKMEHSRRSCRDWNRKDESRGE